MAGFTKRGKGKMCEQVRSLRGAMFWGQILAQKDCQLRENAILVLAASRSLLRLSQFGGDELASKQYLIFPSQRDQLWGGDGSKEAARGALGHHESIFKLLQLGHWSLKVVNAFRIKGWFPARLYRWYRETGKRTR